MSHINRRAVLKLALAAPVVAGIAGQAMAATTHEVTIRSFKFKPGNLKIAVGDTVVFTNKDGAPHTATADNGSFDTGRLGRNKSAEITFDKAGSFPYFCEFHPNMKATITVG